MIFFFESSDMRSSESKTSMPDTEKNAIVARVESWHDNRCGKRLRNRLKYRACIFGFILKHYEWLKLLYNKKMFSVDFCERRMRERYCWWYYVICILYCEGITVNVKGSKLRKCFWNFVENAAWNWKRIF